MKNEIIEMINGEVYNPVTKEELALKLDIKLENIKEYNDLINEMENDCYLYISKKGRILPPSRMGLFVGRFISHRKGFGFIKADYEGVRDLFIPSKNINGAFHNDRVIAEITKDETFDSRAEGKIVKIVKRVTTEIVGKFKPSQRFGFVKPDDISIKDDIYVPEKFFNGAKEDDKVVCEITMWSVGNRKPEGKIVEIIGHKGDRCVEIDSIVKAHKLPDKFPERVMEEAKFVAQPIPQEEINRRLDLRQEVIFTIDGSDAKDLDDAISVEKINDDIFRLGVHIADVSHYVKEKSKLDKEALKRATSVYLVDKVLPMLPKIISNGVCSLNPFEDKLTLSIIMDINKKGEVVKNEIRESVINSKARLTYTEVSDILENPDKDAHMKYYPVLQSIKYAGELTKILSSKRHKRGALDFNFPESKITLDENGVPVNVEPYERRIANRLIEELMLISNETIAEHFYWLEAPFVYRVHETPSSNKMNDFNNFIKTLGYFIKGDLEEVHPKALQGITNKMLGKPEEEVVNTMMLRSLKQAKYSPVCEGHFGLAAKYYCHFTSPIRRYPDLQIHRIIKKYLNGEMNSRKEDRYKSIVDYAATQSSERERIADDVETEVKKYYKSVYMENKIGEEFEGIISNTTQFGFFVKLENTVEGLVRLSSLGFDTYSYDEIAHTITGYNTEKVFKIGDKVKICVKDVDIDMREVYFGLIEE